MGCNDMLQTPAIQPGQKARRSRIFQVTETPTHAPLETCRIIALREHLRIMIAFQYQRIAVIQYRLDMWSGASGIRKHALPKGTIAENELCRLICIVRNRIRLDLDIVDGEAMECIDNIYCRQSFESPPDTA
jgi:hypothetical protein